MWKCFFLHLFSMYTLYQNRTAINLIVAITLVPIWSVSFDFIYLQRRASGYMQIKYYKGNIVANVDIEKCDFYFIVQRLLIFSSSLFNIALTADSIKKFLNRQGLGFHFEMLFYVMFVWNSVFILPKHCSSIFSYSQRF